MAKEIRINQTLKNRIYIHGEGVIKTEDVTPELAKKYESQLTKEWEGRVKITFDDSQKEIEFEKPKGKSK